MTQATTQAITDALRSLDPYAFEEFVADLWSRQGYDTHVTTASRDRGIDVVATKEKPYRQKVVIQTKRYAPQNKVGTREVQQYNSIRRQADADVVVIVTTSTFTAGAADLADQLNVKRVDGDRLAEIVREVGARDLVAEYIGGDGETTQTTLDDQLAADETSADQTGGSGGAVRAVLRTGVLVSLLGAALYIGTQYVLVTGGL